jgi:hypothetical protein
MTSKTRASTEKPRVDAIRGQAAPREKTEARVAVVEARHSTKLN